jgi:Gpi18-like mannosyltransferase
MAKVQIPISRFIWASDFLFPAGMWLASRLVIWIAMLLIAPQLPSQNIVPGVGWGVFYAWDSEHYHSIVTAGYKFVEENSSNHYYNLAFFPLFPLIIRALMGVGLSFHVAGVLVNNAAFLAALYFLYLWIKQHNGLRAAQWATTVIAWCPMSMFCAVIYTEGLYLFLSTAALRAFDQKQYGWTALWGAMATATRPTGMALIPSLAIAAWKESRPPIAYIAAFSTAAGVLLFSLYSAIYFHHPLAFIHAQKAWRPSLGFDSQGWWNMILEVVAGQNNLELGW